jgi:hypothetical protein
MSEEGSCSFQADEVLTRQCPCLGLSIHGAYAGAWRIRRLQTETGVHTNLPRFGPPEGNDLHPACLILYCLYSWSCYNGAQMGSSYGWKRWRVLAYVRDLCEIRYLCEISLSRGCSWWLYICSQLGFTSSFCLLLQVEMLGLAGFMYPSSGLLPWQEPDRLISRTRGVIPSSQAMLKLAQSILKINPSILWASHKVVGS